MAGMAKRPGECPRRVPKTMDATVNKPQPSDPPATPGGGVGIWASPEAQSPTHPRTQAPV